MNLRKLTQNQKNSLFSVISAIVTGATLFLTYKLLAKEIGLEEIGLWSVILASTSAAKLSELGISGGIVTFVAKHLSMQERRKASECVQTAVIAIGVFTTVILIALYAGSEYIFSKTIPLESIDKASQLLPFACASLWLNSIAGVLQSALDGCQRMDRRNILGAAGSILNYAMVTAVVPYYGLKGLASAQVVQAAFIILGTLTLLRREIPELPRIFFVFYRPSFDSMFKYGINFQFNTILNFLFEPTTKLLLSKFGGLAQAANYEMASQIVLKIRALLISSNQYLTPAIAAAQGISTNECKKIFEIAYSRTILLTTIGSAFTCLLLPTISNVWFGKQNLDFTYLGYMLTFGWAINCISSPAYFANLGTSHLRVITTSHLVQACISITLGVALGAGFGFIGIGISTMVALTVAAMYVTISTNLRLDMKFQWALIPPNQNFFANLALLGLAFLIAQRFVIHGQEQSQIEAVFGLILFAFVSIYVFCKFINNFSRKPD